MHDAREKTDRRAQGAYWDALSDEYARMTRIDETDFHYGPQIPGESALRLLPPLGPGASALEIGCGGAQNSVWLARRGVRCTALDISEGQLRHARALAARCGVAIDLRRAAFEDFGSVLPAGALFDLVHSSHALEFADDPEPDPGFAMLRIRDWRELIEILDKTDGEGGMPCRPGSRSITVSVTED